MRTLLTNLVLLALGDDVPAPRAEPRWPYARWQAYRPRWLWSALRVIK